MKRTFNPDDAYKALEQGQSFLLLPDTPVVTRRWDTVGLILAPEVGNPQVVNLFRLFLSGHSKPGVDRYLDYLGDKGITGIQVCIEPLDALPTDQKPIEETPLRVDEVLAKFQEYQQSPDFLYSDGDLNFAIQRLHVVTKPPYKVQYVIDPTIWGQGVMQNETRDAAQFGGDYASVYCSASAGVVNMRLLELTYWGSWTDRGSRGNIGGGQQSITGIPRSFTGQWQVEVTGVQAQNNFTLEYESVYGF